VRYEAFHTRLVPAIRWLLGIQYVLGGINWWYKILPFPTFTDDFSLPGKHPVLDAMIATGWMFASAKVIELATGIALLFNRYVPLLLVVAFPVALTTFIVDAFMLDDLLLWLQGAQSGAVFRAKLLDMIFFGGAVLAMHGYLMFAYFDAYRPMFGARNQARPF